MVKEQIVDLIKAKRAHVGVVGLGYVGLPLLAEFARSGFRATGFEVDQNKAARINSGESYIGDIASSAASSIDTLVSSPSTIDLTYLLMHPPS